MDQPEEGSGRDTDDQDAGSAGRDAHGQREEQVVTSVEEDSISNEEATHTAEGLPVEKQPKKKGRPKGSKNKPREKAPSDTIVPPAAKKKRGRPKGATNKDAATRTKKVPKKKGRPQGSKNKPQEETRAAKKKRGRPKGAKNNNSKDDHANPSPKKRGRVLASESDAESSSNPNVATSDDPPVSPFARAISAVGNKLLPARRLVGRISTRLAHIPSPSAYKPDHITNVGIMDSADMRESKAEIAKKRNARNHRGVEISKTLAGSFDAQTRNKIQRAATELVKAIKMSSNDLNTEDLEYGCIELMMAVRVTAPHNKNGRPRTKFASMEAKHKYYEIRDRPLLILISDSMKSVKNIGSSIKDYLGELKHHARNPNNENGVEMNVENFNMVEPFAFFGSDVTEISDFIKKSLNKSRDLFKRKSMGVEEGIDRLMDGARDDE
jgi:high mobility group AT-hook protein 2